MSGRARERIPCTPVDRKVHHHDVRYRRVWARVLEYIDQWASAREVPGGIQITFEQSPGVPRTVEVVVTPDDWDTYLSVIWGTEDPRVTPFKDKVHAMPADMGYLVYDTYDWWPSHTPESPEDDLLTGPGEWVVTDRAGKVIDRFADWDDVRD